MRAWSRMFNDLPRTQQGDDASPYTDQDYYDYVDGKPRYDGVRLLPRVARAPGARRARDRAGRPQERHVRPGAARRGRRRRTRARCALLESLRDRGMPMAIVSSSRNAPAVLEAAGVTHFFSAVVHGGVAAEKGLAGKPAPDTFWEAADELGVPHDKAVVLEDATSGVAAGAAGKFALVIGVDRGAGADALTEAGADLVVTRPGGAPVNPHGPGPSHKAPAGRDPLDRTRFPIDEWRLVETRFDDSDLGTTESLFSVGNGYLGLRGNYEESRDFDSNGTYVNGFHETWPIQHAEEAFGFAKVGQTIVNAPDAKIIRLYVDDEPLELSTADLREYERALDLRTGVLTRTLLWRTPERQAGAGGQPPDGLLHPAPPRVHDLRGHPARRRRRRSRSPPSCSTAGRRQRAPGAARRWRTRAWTRARRSSSATGCWCPRSTSSTTATGRLRSATTAPQSGMTIAVAADHLLATDQRDQVPGREQRRHRQGDLPDPGRAGPHDPADQDGQLPHRQRRPAARAARPLRAHPRPGRRRGRRTTTSPSRRRTWPTSGSARDVEVPGQPEIQQAVRWNLFSVMQASARADGSGISAKGVTGSGYGGHYFWDTEIYVMPFLTYTTPGAARNALRFRYSLLDSRPLPGPRAHPEGRPVPVAHDQRRGGVGVLRRRHRAVPHRRRHRLRAQPVRRRHRRRRLPATGRPSTSSSRPPGSGPTWGSGATSTDGAFHIHGVTGPDEYTTVVNDNLYTNVMARFNLRRAAEAVRSLADSDPAAYDAMMRRVGLDDGEVEEWARCAREDGDPVRRAPRHPPAGLPLPRARDVGPRAHAARRSGRCC